MKRLLYLAVLSGLALLILAPAALAQSDSLESQGVTQPCPFQLDRFPAGTVCGEGGAYIDPEDQTAVEPVAEDVADEEITCEDFEDQGQAQEALGRVLRGDPAAEADVLDEDGDGIACEDLLTVTDPNAPAPETKTGETTSGETTVSGGGTTGEEKTRRERREKSKGEGTATAEWERRLLKKAAKRRTPTERAAIVALVAATAPEREVGDPREVSRWP